jgi:hypothetical protein
MTTNRQVKAIDLYKVLMFEARKRIDAINFILAGQTRLAEGIVRELCYLQLRMLCETIAIGCLVAHGDIVEKRIRDFEKEWSPEKIFKQLDTLNPHFFPQQADFASNSNVFSVNANTKPNALKKEELPKLWAKCGDVLHRGTLKKLMQSDPLKHGRMDPGDVVKWAQKIEDLLGSHLIPLWVTENESAIMICALRDAGKNMETTVQRLEMKRSTSPSQ